MRTLTRILAVMLACMMLTAICPAMAEETVTINFWHHYSAQSAENETLMNVLIPAFEAENPGIKVNAVSHEWAELHDKVLVSANSNALPDVARCDIAWLPEFQKMGILVALDEEMADFADVSGQLLDSAMSTAVIGGHYYALALNTNSKIVFYNTAMLEAADVKVPTTMDEWVEAIKKLSGENANGQQVWGWNEPALAGWNMVIFLAALQQVPQDLYEAAEIDGCGAWKKFVNVTLPAIRGTILFALIELTIGGFNVFTSIKMITGGKPAHQTDTLLTWMYYKAFSTGKFGYAAALSFVMALSLGLLAIVQFRMMRNKDA